MMFKQSQVQMQFQCEAAANNAVIVQWTCCDPTADLSHGGSRSRKYEFHLRVKFVTHVGILTSAKSAEGENRYASIQTLTLDVCHRTCC
ncbi:hypothetical protein F2P81_025812 [Scophthalmus maximus]|uniref:Uncharacterized protein n=1 Tax=Scophthalmus maximus TaxID=52904 RepID=A0A6A4RNU3_SCOMX|nr:hypothetical protein F2P81_025812 [Scophthalmus maximus]